MIHACSRVGATYPDRTARGAERHPHAAHGQKRIRPDVTRRYRTAESNIHPMIHQRSPPEEVMLFTPRNGRSSVLALA
jgi:hypothetical protein